MSSPLQNNITNLQNILNIINELPEAGVTLNLEVVGSAIEPTNPTESTIWVDTDVQITSYIFSSIEPSVPPEGMLWINVGSSSNFAFSVREENPIMVYPISAKQYVNGVWVDVITKSYRGGEWVDWIIYLLKGAGEYASITGGWQTRAWKNSSSVDTAKAPTLTVNEDSIKLSISAANKYVTGVYECINDIDLTSYSKISIDFSGTASSANSVSGSYLGITQRTGTYINSNRAATLTLVPSATSSVSRKTAELSLEGIEGFWDIVIEVGSNSTSSTASTVTIYEILLS